jgi:hypothetical protein
MNDILFSQAEPLISSVGSLQRKYWLLQTKKNSVAFSPQANYTDGLTAACGRS